MFPKIAHIDDLLWALNDENGVRGDEWVVAERDGFTVVNYAVNFAHTFPDLTQISPDQYQKAITRREARGIKFCSKTGRILARVWHKFFNIGEREETQPHRVNWTDDLKIMSKLDGSMIHPIRLDDTLLLCTKMGHTDVALPAEDFAFNHPTIRYRAFCEHMIDNGYTPIFEWCSRKQRIVVDYPQDMLVLTGIRDMVSGEYVSYDVMLDCGKQFGFPVVEVFGTSIEDIAAWLDKTRGETEGEGYVVTFADGRRYKAKNEHYCRIHHTKELLALEKNVWDIVLSESADDAMSFMEETDRARLQKFTDDLLHEINNVANRLQWTVDLSKIEIEKTESDPRLAKKVFALEHGEKFDKRLRGLAFQIWDGKDARKLVTEFVKLHTGTLPRLESIRDLVPIHWNNY